MNKEVDFTGDFRQKTKKKTSGLGGLKLIGDALLTKISTAFLMQI